MEAHMKQFIVLLTFAVSVVVHAAEGESIDNWPKQFSSDGKNFTVYQPQVESWKDNRIEERVAVSVQAGSSSSPTFGVIWLKARADVDKPERVATLQDIEITKISFPTETGQEGAYKQVMQDNSREIFGNISLDRLRASLAINTTEAKHKVDGLKNDPPEIYFSDKPAVMALVDGQGVLRDTSSPGISRVVNTRALILFNKSTGVYYMNVADHWYQSTSLDGAWKTSEVDGKTLDGLNSLKNEFAKDTDSFEKTPEIAAAFSSTKPAELVQSKGSPNFEPIKGTELLYVTNSPNNIFMYTADQNYFVTLSGRWFKSRSLKGPWKFIAADSLPKDFAEIPEGHPKGEVLASVAGTPDAKEAEIASEIPQTATVDRTTAKLAVEYDGQPKFVAISGSPLYYASNTRTPVINVNGTYYAVENGVWFMASTPQGPWGVTSEVPAVIYTIPPSAPVYYVTYAYVYGSDSYYVYVGYLPGYLGSYVAPSGVVVYGTGYYYRPWCDRVWYGYPYTYGFGFTWGFGFGWTFRTGFYGAPVYRPWWGPWPHYWAHYERPWGERHVTINHINVYRNWEHNVLRPTHIETFHPARGMPSHVIAGSPVHTVHEPIHVHQPGHVQEPIHTATRNNVYADHSGNIYRHEPAQGWQHYQSNQWQPVKSETPHSSPSMPSQVHEGVRSNQHVFAAPHDLDRERVARERGAIHTQRFSPQVHAAAPSGGRAVPKSHFNR
jgi:hypothetical protein